MTTTTDAETTDTAETRLARVFSEQMTNHGVARCWSRDAITRHALVSPAGLDALREMADVLGEADAGTVIRRMISQWVPFANWSASRAGLSPGPAGVPSPEAVLAVLDDAVRWCGAHGDFPREAPVVAVPHRDAEFDESVQELIERVEREERQGLKPRPLSFAELAVLGAPADFGEGHVLVIPMNDELSTRPGGSVIIHGGQPLTDAEIADAAIRALT